MRTVGQGCPPLAEPADGPDHARVCQTRRRRCAGAHETDTTHDEGSSGAMDERAYLIVYHTYPEHPATQWFDKLWDPDLRASPFTWGVCRPDVRKYAQVGSHLFFVAYHMEGHKRQLDERYYFAAHFRVGERISHVEAVRRFPDRSNVILEHLPNGTSLATRLRAYLVAHEATLNWADREQILHILASG